MNTHSIYDLEFKTLNGETVQLSQFRGKKILFVNTASKCGYTPQYAQLEELHKTYGEKLVVIGFPSNQFGNQEPGSNTEIQEFCQQNYGVSFIMAEKIDVKGDNAHPVYKWLTLKSMNEVEDSEVKWNFQKYLVDENGRLIGEFGSKVNPLSEEITVHLN